MQELKQILIKKAKIIGELKYPQRSNREAILKYLKKIRKQEKESEHKQKIVVQSLHEQKSLNKQYIEKVYFMSFTIMKGFCKKFQFIPEQKDLFTNIIEMHYNFYIKQQFVEKAEQIKEIYRNKIYQKEILLPTLFSWFYDWGRNKLQKFLHKNIQSIQKDLIIDQLESPTKSKLKEGLSIKSKKQSLLSQLVMDGKQKKISFTEKWEKPQTKILNGSSKILSNQFEDIQIGQFLNSQKMHDQEQMINSSMNRVETLFQLERNDQNSKNVFLKNRSRSYNIGCRQKTVISININKQIFYGTFWKEMHQLYRNMNCIEDLDSYYLKTFKKQKEQVKDQIITYKIDDLVESIIKNMLKVKKSIDTYDKQYEKQCPQAVKQFHKGNKLKIKRNASAQYSKIFDLQSPNHFLKFKNLRSKTLAKSHNGLILPEKQKISDQIQQNLFKEKSVKQSTIVNKILQRNRSYGDTILRKAVQQKADRQIKLPIVYNPEQLCYQRQSDADKALMIHQKFEKYMINGSRPNKGLIRYKHSNRDKQKTTFDNYEQISQKIAENMSVQIQLRKQHQYEVANIRKILRKRQKQRMYENKTPILESHNEQEQVQRAILQIKVLQTQRKLESQKNDKKGEKFQVFLSNLRTSSTPHNYKKNSKSFNFGSFKSSQLIIDSVLNQDKSDMLPKIC